MNAVTRSISISIAGVRKSISPAGLDAILGALDVGSDGFGQTDTDEAECAEREAWEIIKLFRQAKHALDPAEVTTNRLTHGLVTIPRHPLQECADALEFGELDPRKPFVLDPEGD